MVQALMKGVPATSLSAVTTGTGTPFAVPSTSKSLRAIVRAAGTVSGGAVAIEEASSAVYSGTWSLIQSVTPVTDSEVVVHIPGTFGAVRGRISSDITGGATVTVEFISN